MYMKKVLKFAAVACSMALLVGCGSTSDSNDTSNYNEKSESVEFSVKQQVSMPEAGETVACIEIEGFGEIKVKFFEEVAPKAVENFITHSKEGYYDGVKFHRVIEDFMIQGGDPGGDGRGGESIWGEAFEDEFHEEALPIRGALCMANAGEDTNGSQFFIVQAKTCSESTMQGLTQVQKEIFAEWGGTPWLTGAHTVFGQVYEGMNVLDAIAATPTDGNDAPLDDVVIKTIRIETYQ